MDTYRTGLAGLLGSNVRVGERSRRCVGGWLSLAAAFGAGCGGNAPARAIAPAFDPVAIVTALFDERDRDGDGSLSADEVAAVPAVKGAMASFDHDRDGAIAREELSRWLVAVRNSRVAVTSLVATVTRKGKPLSAVSVRLVPLGCMQGAIQTAEGTTDNDGIAACGIPGNPHPGVNCGLYRVEITGNGPDGKPLGPRYNAASEYGIAVGPDEPPGGLVTFAVE